MASFHDIYQRYANYLHRFGLALSDNRAIAEDLVSETFVPAMSSANATQLETVGAYLFTILRHVFLEHRKKILTFYSLFRIGT